MFRFGFVDKDSVIGWILSFRDQAELLEPVELRQELEEILKGMQKKYES